MIPDDPDWETEYRDWQEQLHRRYRKELPKEFAESENAQAEDSVEARWQPAPRVTEADATNDTKSLQRKLDRRLFLLLKGKGTLMYRDAVQSAMMLGLATKCTQPEWFAHCRWWLWRPVAVAHQTARQRRDHEANSRACTSRGCVWQCCLEDVFPGQCTLWALAGSSRNYFHSQGPADQGGGGSLVTGNWRP